MRYAALPAREHGFTLIEVMVAVLVITVGLLGIAKMEALALSNANTSRLRSLAAIEAAGLAASMHSDRAYWGGPSPPASVTVNPVNTPAITSSDGALQTQTTAYSGLLNPLAQGAACVGSSAPGVQCTPVQIAAFDTVNWTRSLATLLPAPRAQIVCAGGPPPSCTIQIQWTENAMAIAGANETGGSTWSAGYGQFALPTYLLYVEP